jgi:hypothetical protein
MKHERHYTVEQANAALPWVMERIERLRAAREGFADEDAREALGEATPGNGGGEPGRVVSEAFLELQAAATELDAMEVVVRDLERDATGLLERLARLVLRAPVLEQIVAPQEQRADAIGWVGIRHRCDHSRVKLAPCRTQSAITSTSRRRS